ncbi:MAG: type II and III secretion system protein family protein, partial [Rhodospirillaceae bacterium]|nr:type II and III secretion system protein family protein [Rhodospirillaceae bacterium]
QQVIMQVRIAEIKRTALKQLGVNLGINGLGAPGSRGISFSTTSAAIPNAFLNNGLINTGLGGFGPITFEALEKQGLAKTLAEPTLTAQSGQSASFRAGGSIPVPELANGVVAVRMIPYGIGLDFTPVVLDKGNINLVVTTTVSEIDGSVPKINEVPALKEKTTSTTVDLPSGGTLFIAGLIQNDVSNTINGVPGLKDLPILGALFRSDTFISNETELVITMTAYLAKPVSNTARLALPTDGFAPASDIDFFLLGRLHKTYTNKELPPYATPLAGPYGYIME